MSTLAGQVSTKITMLKSAYVKLASNDGTEKTKVVAGKKIDGKPPLVPAYLVESACFSSQDGHNAKEVHRAQGHKA